MTKPIITPKTQREKLHLAFLLFVGTFFISIHLPHKALGNLGIAIYFLGLLMIIAAILNRKFISFLYSWYSKNERLSFGIFILVCISTFLIFHPLENYLGEVFNPGNSLHGSDRADANNKGIEEILKGNFPYYVKTYLNGPISSFPGAFFISSPFYIILGDSAYQNIFWLIAFTIFLLKKSGRNSSFTVLLLVIFSFSSPVFFYEYITGSDFFTVSALITMLSVYLVEKVDGHFSLKPGIIAFLLGVVFSWKINFILISPVIFFILAKKNSFSTSLKYCTVIALGFLLVTLPFALYDLVNFTPLSISNKIKLLGYDYDHIDKIIVLLTLLYSLTALKVNGNYSENFLKKSLGVLVIPIVCTTILSIISAKEFASFLIYGLLSYGLSYYGFFLVFMLKKYDSYIKSVTQKNHRIEKNSPKKNSPTKS